VLAAARTPLGIAGIVRRVKGAAAENPFGAGTILIAIYLVLQSLCIPGTIVLNCIMGGLFGAVGALPLCVLAGGVGAVCCFLLSAAAGAQLASSLDRRLMKGRGIERLRAQVSSHRDELFGYLLFLRLTPVLPNWLINLASPVLGVPMRLFFAATIVGITPQTYLAVRFGSIAEQLAARQGTQVAAGQQQPAIVTAWDTALIAVLGVTAVVVSRMRKRFGGATGSTD
jgi:uncharacterized membrane protein YdjX (TVP38/TMEM64 family)